MKLFAQNDYIRLRVTKVFDEEDGGDSTFSAHVGISRALIRHMPRDAYAEMMQRARQEVIDNIYEARRKQLAAREIWQ
jgi:hypothetical protein